MPKKRYTAEDIIHKLRGVDVLPSQGSSVAQVCKQLGIVDKTYYRLRKNFGRMKVDQAKRLKELEAENARLKRAVAHIRSAFGHSERRICIALGISRNTVATSHSHETMKRP